MSDDITAQDWNDFKSNVRFNWVKIQFNNHLDIEDESIRYVLKLEKYGVYIYDRIKQQALSLIETVNLLNKERAS